MPTVYSGASGRPERFLALAHRIIGTYNLLMAQITIYLPEDVARRIKREAKRRKKSVSAFIADLATGRGTRPAWPKQFFRLQGSCKGSLRAPEDPPPDELSL